jgi:hypothetical protein
VTQTTFYTIFLEYRGGTYISQVSSSGPAEALEAWAASLPEEDLQAWNLKRDGLMPVIRDGSLVSITGLVNAWCLSGVDDNDEQLLLNVIATVDG